MRLLLDSLAALLPELAADADAVLALPEPQQWDALYYRVILPHLVYNKEHDRDAVGYARIVWFRYISVCGRPQRGGRGDARRPEVDMRPKVKVTSSRPWTPSKTREAFTALSGALKM